MATLTKSTGTVTLSGTAEKVTLPAAYGWVWLKNMSDADMFAGLSADILKGFLLAFSKCEGIEEIV